MPPMPSLTLLCLVLFCQEGTQAEPGRAADERREDPETRDPLALACELFRETDSGFQGRVVGEIAARLEVHADPGVREWLKLRARALRELKVIAAPPRRSHAAEQYAPEQPRRAYLEEGDVTAVEMEERFHRHGSEPFFARRVRHDFAWNVALDLRAEWTHWDVLYNYLYGLPPDADHVIAWLEGYFDFRDDLDPVADHFSRSYADLNGRCHPYLTLYDAFSSFQGVDMPDVDVIAFARSVLGDHSHVSPIPPGSRQTELYRQVHDGFLHYFQERTMVEYTAGLLLNPEAPMDYAHATLRDRILYGFHLDSLDLQQIRQRLVRAGSRGAWVTEIDAASTRDPYWREYARRSADRIHRTRWVIAELTHQVLRDFGLMAPRESAAADSE